MILKVALMRGINVGGKNILPMRSKISQVIMKKSGNPQAC